jgi:hypothetical protein
MKPLSLLLFAVCLVLSDAAFARGGMGSHMSMSGGGALGSSGTAPGTNSSGTALPSGIGGHVMKGPLLGTDPIIDKEDAQLQKRLEGSICRGC